jgi:hypothetical protein
LESCVDGIQQIGSPDLVVVDAPTHRKRSTQWNLNASSNASKFEGLRRATVAAIRTACAVPKALEGSGIGVANVELILLISFALFERVTVDFRMRLPQFVQLPGQCAKQSQA